MSIIRKRRDKNHAEIVQALRAAGASVVDTADVGGGFPDLVAGYGGTTLLIEVKTENGKLRSGQDEFRKAWRGGTIVVVRSADEALRLLNRLID